MAERSHVVESAKPGKPPPAEPREARREGAGGAQRRATRSAAGGHDPPLDAKPARGKQLFPRKLSRESRPARPAGGGTNAFCFPSLVAPAPPRHRNILHKTQNSAVLHVGFSGITCPTQRFFRSRPARVLFNRFSINNPRASAFRENPVLPRPRAADKRFRLYKPRAPAIKDNRLPLYKRSVSTSPLPLLLAFPRPFPFREISAVPRPCLKKQGRAGGVPKGGRGHPWGEPFPTSFPFVRKRGPCGAKTNKL